MKENKKWEKLSSNYVLKGKGYYISYNPCIEPNPFDEGLGLLGVAESRIGLDETALRDEKNNIWYILNGDFRKEYEKCRSLKECIKVYSKNKKLHRSDFSTD